MRSENMKNKAKVEAIIQVYEEDTDIDSIKERLWAAISTEFDLDKLDLELILTI